MASQFPTVNVVGMDTFTRLFASSVDLTAIVLNLGLLTIILNCSHFRKTYRHILLLSCISDICLALTGFLAQPVTLLTGILKVKCPLCR